MPKMKARKHSSQGNKAARARQTTTDMRYAASPSHTETAVNAGMSRGIDSRRSKRLVSRTRGPKIESLVMPALVALGFWGMTISFVFFYSDPNHYLYGGLCAAAGLCWSISVGVRLVRMRKAVVR